ncbi:MAG: undecaprenyl diphosphate synthase [Planctomycetota bacterium]|jgi:undecaprenyl diphosphate synthase
MSNSESVSIPRHVCIIMDGNGRWAKKRLMPRNMGHRKGVETARRAIAFFAGFGVQHLTLFAFSSENWNRPSEEVNGLMDLFMQSLKQNIEELDENNIRIRFIGDRDQFSEPLRAQILVSEQKTKNNHKMTLNVAANYGGQWDITQAVQKLAVKIEAGTLKAVDLTTGSIADELSLADSPLPDLFVRSGGEHRVSNFLLWQLAYSEFYFSDVLWPDFDEKEMQLALDDYANRQRRYGRTGEQIEVLS